MKRVIFFGIGLLGFSGGVWGQVPQDAQTQPVLPPQTALISQEAAWWLANPQALFLQLDVDKDGLLNAAEFSRVGLLSTQVVVPGAAMNGGPATNSFTPPTGVKPTDGAKGPFTPPPWVSPGSQGGAATAPMSPATPAPAGQ